jgi:hypothetical protein
MGWNRRLYGREGLTHSRHTRHRKHHAGIRTPMPFTGRLNTGETIKSGEFLSTAGERRHIPRQLPGNPSVRLSRPDLPPSVARARRWPHPQIATPPGQERADPASEGAASP